MSILRRLFARRPIVDQLLRLSAMLGVFVLTCVIGNFFLSGDKQLTWSYLGYDFLPFYFGGTMVRTGHAENLYDLPYTQHFEITYAKANQLAIGPGFGPWWNPPFAGYLFAPLSALPFPLALDAWWAIGAICLTASLWMLTKMLGGTWKHKTALVLLVVCSTPCFQVFCHGQNTYVSLLILTTTVALWRQNQNFLAGIVSGLLLYKPQLGLVVALVLCVTQGRRALLGWTLTATALLVINILTLPGTLHTFVRVMPVNMQWFQESLHYRWERHMTLKSFWRLLLQGWDRGPNSPAVLALWVISEMALLIPLLLMLGKYVLRSREEAGEKSLGRDRLIAASILAMPLLMPFYFDYDLLLSCVGITLYARQRGQVGRAIEWEDRALIATLSALYVAMEFPSLLGNSRFHLAVPMLAISAGLMIRSAMRGGKIASSKLIAQTTTAAQDLSAKSSTDFDLLAA